ncbi:hypothetical protein CH64_2153 [Yersinia rohdei]|uniref:Protein of uncharacterized function (DUF1656) n=1 Tax=Yersinia rohdei TaxID=29485 RepID=A0A0U1HNJ6_YERRO|nr:DUF1656 domain-containing protein [Yersinia rohdei]AJJ11058.1 hypothetical protein CH64_2153 [Yersinia rohdei]MDN0095585.1 DUF1656 domain-containing protein [Yersinia rohdei]OWF82094.1 DUF1656 domain-containing protein [Yersinia rohdei]CNE61029.1 Protein of uncharacterised function (DUF1656) [Yersinia rohdei]CNI45089.1 Protein of uncharacterised function (DUF1656) [Yersinia rohdei]
MPHELSFGGIYVPGPLALIILMLPLFWLLDLGLARMGLYRRAIHPSLIRVALFILIYSLTALILF